MRCHPLSPSSILSQQYNNARALQIITKFYTHVLANSDLAQVLIADVEVEEESAVAVLRAMPLR